MVFQLCGQRPVAEIAAELAEKLKLGLETRPPEEQIAGAKAWLAERQALLVLDDIWENDVKALVPGPPVSLLCTSRRRSLPWISLTNSLEVKSFSRGEAESIFRIYLKNETVEKHRDALLEFAERMERLPIAIVVGADILRTELDPVPEAARALRLEKLRNEVHNVAALWRRAIAARPEEAMRATGLSMRRCCECWIGTGSASSCTPCCGRSCRTLRLLRNSRRLMPRPWRSYLPIGNGAGANAASACLRSSRLCSICGRRERAVALHG